MAGTLTISTLSDGTNSTSSTNCIQGSAKAWARFSGASGTINGSYNISSVVRNSTGQYTVNFTNAMANANYSVMSSASPNAAGSVNGGLNVMFTSGGAALVTPTTSAFQFICYSVSVANIDPNWVCIAVFD
jgi:hypothetical protein